MRVAKKKKEKTFNLLQDLLNIEVDMSLGNFGKQAAGMSKEAHCVGLMTTLLGDRHLDIWTLDRKVRSTTNEIPFYILMEPSNVWTVQRSVSSAQPTTRNIQRGPEYLFVPSTQPGRPS
jgi:hypothetical protein